MSTFGLIGELLGNPAFSEYGIHLWWEKVHSACNIIYIVLLFAFGIRAATYQPSCMPKSENVTNADFTDTSGSLVSDVCLSKMPFYNIVNVCFTAIYVSLILQTLSVSITRLLLSRPLSLFSTAETKYASLDLPLKNVKRLATEPNFSGIQKNSSLSTELYDIIALLSKCDKTAKVSFFIRFVVREVFVIVYLGLCWWIVLTMAIWSANFFFFDCTLTEFESQEAFNARYNFLCILPTYGSTIDVFYFMLLGFHCICHARGLFYFGCLILWKQQRSVLPFLTTLWAQSRTVERQEFGKFVKFVFSHEASDLMRKNLDLVGANADESFTNMVSDFVGQSFYNTKLNLETLIEEKRWAWIVVLLEKLAFEDLAALASIDVTELDSDSDIGAQPRYRRPTSYQEVESQVSRMSHQSLAEAGEESESRRPERLPLVAESRSEMPQVRKQTRGRSILFYALNRDPSCATFQMRAAKQILEATRGKQRVVCYNGAQISAKEFVEMQHASDPTYPDRVKDSLLRLVEAGEVNTKPDLQGLIDNKRWECVVEMLEKFPKPYENLATLKNSINILDGQGRSILFYALNRTPGCATFQMRAAKQILESTNGKDVFYNGGKVSAKEFVKMQHASDPTYPDRIKDLLLRLIESEEINSNTNLQDLIKNKRWASIVILLEKFPKPFEDLGLDIRDLDGKGRSILYYALTRDPDKATFQMRAAKRILESTRGQERVVFYNDGQVSAKEFVEMQYASDPSYPDRIKDILLGFIDSEG